jgi:hypothetical protein
MRALWALVAGIAGVAFALTGLVAGGFAAYIAQGNLPSNFALGSPLLNGFGIAIPALVLGPLAYFLGRSAMARIAASEGKLGGRPTAGSAWPVGIAATVLGAASTLAWIVMALLGFFGLPPSG